ncbi:MAG TPA: helix-turn-helix transcriptional regulator [bacterium]|jgi:transcriptional regulator with XRE-family HTH domain|nr:helix-turn-helix transcriptional regulator [bacterium]
MPLSTTLKPTDKENYRLLVGSKIAALRAAAGLTQASLAKRAGVSLKTLYTIERAAPDTNFTLLSLEALADALGTSVAELMRSAGAEKR